MAAVRFYISNLLIKCCFQNLIANLKVVFRQFVPVMKRFFEFEFRRGIGQFLIERIEPFLKILLFIHFSTFVSFNFAPAEPERVGSE
jgi:hypothetical protein